MTRINAWVGSFGKARVMLLYNGGPALRSYCTGINHRAGIPLQSGLGLGDRAAIEGCKFFYTNNSLIGFK